VKTRAWIVACLLAAVAVGWFVWPADTDPRVSTGDEESAERLGATRHHFEYEGRQRVDLAELGAESFTGVVHLEGELVLDVLGPRRYAIAFARLETHELRVDGDEVIDEETARSLESNALVIQHDGRGRVLHFQAASDAPVLFLQMARQVALELQHARVPGNVRETAPFGEAESHYVLEDGALVRTRRRYVEIDAPAVDERQSVDGFARVVRDGEGLVSFDGRETLETATLSVSTRLRTERLDDAPRIALARELVEVEAGTPARTEGGGSEMLESRVDGLTVDALVDSIARFGNGGELPDHHRTLWRATGLLQQQPGAARSLRGVFRDPGSNQHTRALVLDLLAHAGTREARDVLLELVAEMRGSEHYATYLQRLGFLREPGEEARALAEAALEDPSTELPAAYALGSMAQHLDASEAEEVMHTLRARLEEGPADERPHWIRAVANAHDESDVARFALYAGEESRRTRDAVAEALGGIDTDPSRRVLYDMLDQDDLATQRSVFSALGHHTLDEDDLVLLEERVSGLRVVTGAFGELTQILRRQAEAHPAAARRCLEAMASRRISDPATRTRIYGLLARLPAS